MKRRRLTGQSLLRVEWNSNRCNWSTARKKIGPVNRPCDRPIDVISIRFAHYFGDVTIGRSTDEEIRGGENVHVAANKVLPGGRFAPLRNRGDAMPAQDAAHGLVRHLM